MSSHIPKEKRVLIHKKYNKKCAYCGINIDYDKMHVDHIVPIYRGSTQSELNSYNVTKGTNRIENLNPSCPSCNSSKSTFTLEKWRNEISLKRDRIRVTSSNFRILERYKLVTIKKSDVVFYFEKLALKKSII